ncbi:MAG: CBS domain-containing protein [Acidobacteriota bacterium]|nr:CBS domain-containing protein [Acidobacteriota bacterium]
MHVSDLLAVKGREVATISQELTVADALGVLRDRGIGAIVVTASVAPLSGILSERDIVRALAVHGAAALDMTVSDLMSTTVTTCTEETSVDELMALMTERRIRHVPVVVDAVLVGLVSIGDVVKARVDELERDRRELIDYVNAR